ncbi:tRNA (N(6)-L-threonylcarbamoyladenosine(37)-C(2))-methylthiotransferase MtaB [Candidatus Clavichlamydia salmonicola]|uniref:tRNA (N(6)-L-threonylcarbamoyladenosine(37)-C(2))- methylthiotransferase MtaB n=1 Tax=Candidatus Clavichlamydia salmonicola TaxID=469812 RepID=UPI0018918BC7|nr:tRNA (N(6)-L-threonylcarbamoyladenosine(37)-C(2))-methylthiotransferase MtaB [Candidatus Clavichlamydia salmonicola]
MSTDIQCKQEKPKGLFRLVYLGCRVNQYEIQAYRDQIKLMGYKEVENDDVPADVCVINTCTVTSSAASSSRNQIRRLIRNNPNAKIFVTGCFSEETPDLMTQFPGITAVIPNSRKEFLLEELLNEGEELPEFSIKRFDDHSRAFIKIQDGCNSFCTYCIIPYVRGRSRSKKIPAILKEINEVVNSGYREVVIAGINLGDFKDAQHSLGDLLRAVNDVEGLERIRLSSIDPDDFDDDLTEAVINTPKVCPSLHLVLQSGSNVTLKRMNRKYTRQIFLDRVHRFKEQIPGFTFSTDVIVGFPGETERDFQETLDVIEEVGFVKVHIFPYSPRKGTRAAQYDGMIPKDVMDLRKSYLARYSEERAFRQRQQYIGKEISVLTEQGKGDYISGHSPEFIKIMIPRTNEVRVNRMVKVLITENSLEGLIGRPV